MQKVGLVRFTFPGSLSGRESFLLHRLIGRAVLRTRLSINEHTTNPNFSFVSFDSVAAAFHAREADWMLGLRPSRLTENDLCGHGISVVWHRLLQSPS